ncbi:MAG: ActS/PrrB/RegB family redox-sensitive histidine kinase [Alphaproteobacteria bacterium]|nr:ActS/PrrB/RegB family redox-sensitive histidine kinase [Alphaproteobacteria bacterium]
MAGDGSSIDDTSRDGRPAGLVRLSTLVAIRWISICGQTVSLLIVHLALGMKLPFGACLAIVALSAVANATLQVRGRGRPMVGERTAAVMLAFDLAQLAALLFLTGGVENPFVVLILGPVTVSASVLSRSSTAVLSAFAIGIVGLLTVEHMPSPVRLEAGSASVLYTVGSWVALTVAVGFIATYTWYVAQDARRLHAALAATEATLAREQRLASLGALAAAVAHDLGTPLATIAVTAREIGRALESSGLLAEDVALLRSQTERCREILARLAREPEPGTEDSFVRPTLGTIAEAAAGAQAAGTVAVSCERSAVGDDAGSEPVVLRQAPEIRRALGLLIQNAAQFARSRVDVTVRWSADAVEVVIQDDGPGFPSQVLDRLGEPYVSVRSSPDGHLGLGIFIADTLLRRAGAHLRFANVAPSGAEAVRWTGREAAQPEQCAGAKVEIRWPKSHFTVNAQPE